VIIFTKLKVVRSALTSAINDECVCKISKKILIVKVGKEAKENTNESRKNIKTTKNKKAQNKFRNPIVKILSFRVETSYFPIEVEISLKKAENPLSITPNIIAKL
jgi:hypothetical protein